MQLAKAFDSSSCSIRTLQEQHQAPVPSETGLSMMPRTAPTLKHQPPTVVHPLSWVHHLIATQGVTGRRSLHLAWVSSWQVIRVSSMAGGISTLHSSAGRQQQMLISCPAWQWQQYPFVMDCEWEGAVMPLM